MARMTNRYPPANYIRRVEIDELFGETSVKLVAPWMSDPRILVLYGDNGTGKTTILNIIRSLISSEAAGGIGVGCPKFHFHVLACTWKVGDVLRQERRMD